MLTPTKPRSWKPVARSPYTTKPSLGDPLGTNPKPGSGDPLVKGGQGRSDNELQDMYETVYWIAIMVVVGLSIGAVVALVASVIWG